MALQGAVLLEALDRQAATAAEFPDKGDLIADMRTTIRDVFRCQANPASGHRLPR